MTIADIHARIGGHPNRFRAPLERLVADGFADETTVTSSGRGRPARAYAATAVGVQVALEDPDRVLLDALVEGAADLLTKSHDPVGNALMLGAAWGRRLPGGDLVEALAAQGFAPQVDGDRIVLRTCPMLDAARRNTEVVCAIHLGLMEAISGGALVLVPFAEPGGCVIRGLPGASQRRDLS
jgi:predicted ArsR family transcriptional regulator